VFKFLLGLPQSYAIAGGLGFYIFAKSFDLMRMQACRRIFMLVLHPIGLGNIVLKYKFDRKALSTQSFGSDDDRSAPFLPEQRLKMYYASSV
jgi:hypothetical protein